MKDENKTKKQLINELVEIRRIIELEKFEAKLKQAKEECEMLNLELQKAHSKIKTLSGTLHICMFCKNIRDDKGYWKQIEEYISEHSEAKFSHGLCPECSKKYYQDFHKKK